MKIVYDGDMQGEAVVKDRSRNSNFSIGGVRLNVEGTRRIPVQASYHAEVAYEGDTVFGTERQTSGYRPLNGVFPFRGFRHGDVCELVSEGGARFTAHCTLSDFSYQQTVGDPQNESIRLAVSGRRTATVDLAAQERAAAEQRANAERQRADAERAAAAQRAEADRKAAEFEAMLRSRPRATPAQSEALARAVAADAEGWLMNRYDAGSLVRVVVMPPAADGMVVLRGDYSFNGGSRGWVQARWARGAIQCLEFWDAPGCRPVTVAASRSAPGPAGAGQPHVGYPRWLTFKPLEGDAENGRCIQQASESSGGVRESSRAVGVANGWGGQDYETHTTMQHSYSTYYKNVCSTPVQFQKRFGFFDSLSETMQPGDIVERICQSEKTYTGHLIADAMAPTESCRRGRYFAYKDYVR